MHPKKTRRSVAFGAAGSFVCRRRERSQFSRLDRSAFGKPFSATSCDALGRGAFKNLGGWCFGSSHAYGSHGRTWFGPGSPSTGSLPGGGRSLMCLPTEAQREMRRPFRRSNRKTLTVNLPRDWRMTHAEPFVSVLVRDHGIDRRENRFRTINTAQKSRVFDRTSD